MISILGLTALAISISSTSTNAWGSCDDLVGLAWINCKYDECHSLAAPTEKDKCLRDAAVPLAEMVSEMKETLNTRLQTAPLCYFPRTQGDMERFQNYFADYQSATGVQRISRAIPGSLKYYKTDEENFHTDFTSSQSRTKGWTVFVNVHIDVPFNTTEGYKRDTRTLNWLMPYEYAKQFTTVEQIHDALALPKEWSNDRPRTHISFVIVPPRTSFSEFMIGHASPQLGAKDIRLGGGIQIRVKDFPAGSVSLTSKLKTERFSMQDLLKERYSDLLFSDSHAQHNYPSIGNLLNAQTIHGEIHDANSYLQLFE